jgi:hypothetical protein
MQFLPLNKDIGTVYTPFDKCVVFDLVNHATVFPRI